MAEPTQHEINELLNAVDRAKRDIAYVDNLLLDTQVIEGTRYKFRFDNDTPPQR